MGFKSVSTRRTTATSAVSNQATVINTGTGNLSVAGSGITSTTSITLGVVTPGQSSANSSVAAQGGPVISTITYLDANNNPTTANAVSTSGGNIKVTGTGFVANSTVYINNSLASNTFVSSTEIRVICPAASAGNVSILLFTPTDVGTQKTNAIRYSGAPTWTTAAVSFQNNAAANVALIASSDSTLTYTLQAGSTLPTGISLNSAGYLVGTATGYNTNTTGTIVLIATDLEGQAAQQTINWTVTSNDPQFPYTSLLLSAATTRQTASFVKDNSTNNFPLVEVGDTRAQSFSPYRGDGYYGVSHSATPDYLSVPHNANFSINTGSTDIFIIEGWFYFNAVTANTSLFDKSGVNGTSFANWTVFLNASSQIALQWGVSGSPGTSTVGLVASTTVPVVGTWYHIVFIKSNADWAVFANGTRIISYNGLNTANDGNPTALKIGYGINSAANNAFFNGYISNVRAWRGTSGAPYSATSSTLTVPTSPLTAISGTTLLTHQSARFVDVSSAAATVTATGANIKVSPAIPFAASSTYATYGSGYFDGTGDYISAAPNAALAMGTGDFTVEWWYYPVDSGVVHYLLDIYDNNSAGRFLIQQNTNMSIGFYGASAATRTVSSANALVKNQWNHIAICRASGSTRIFSNGVQVNTTYSDTGNYTFTSTNLYFGTQNASTTANAGAYGYCSDFRIIKGSGIYTANFTPPTTPLTAVANTQLLTLQTGGAHNNSTFIDNSTFNSLVTRSGNATNGTFSPFSATGWSNYFNGSTDYFTTTDPVNSTTDVTIEFWVNITAVPTTRAFVVQSVGGTTYALTISASATPTISFWNASFSAAKMTTATTLTLNTWYHIAMTKVSNVISIFVNGVKDANTYTLASTMGGGTTLYVGQYSVSANQFFPGYISNLRVVNGPVLYTTNFTPSTTPLTAVANTSLLTCQSNRFRDSSTNNYAITLGGTPSVQAFGPFNASGAYSAATNGGSVYFDGTSDYLSLPSGPNPILAMGTGDWTIEMWMYPTSFASTQLFYDVYDANSTGRLTLQLNTNGTVGLQGASGATRTVTTTSLLLNSWNHVAFCKSSGSTRIFLNGVQGNTTYTDSVNYTCTTGVIYVAANGNLAGNNYFGYLSDFRVLKGTALYAANFTPPTTPLTPVTGTTLLLNGTSGGVIDAHGTSNLETVADAKVTLDKYPYSSAGQSYYFDGTGDYLRVRYNPLYEMISEDFTIECWVYRNAIGAEHNIALTRPSASSTGWGFRINSANTVTFFFTGGTALTSTGTIAATTWTHIAFTKSGNTGRLFINGTIDGSTATMGTGTGSSTDLRIGVDNTDAAGFMNGYISDLRITKGFARYTANFSVPTTPFVGQ